MEGPLVYNKMRDCNKKTYMQSNASVNVGRPPDLHITHDMVMR